MTGVQLVSEELDRELPALLAHAAVVAVVPATDLRGWAAEMAWRVARAAASAGRRTVLVDCFVNAPTLHGVAGESNAEGLVDAFEYGASLNRIVQQQPQADLFFIPAGTYTADAEPVMQHPRWRRLSAGFRHEEALLLLYVGAEHLAGLAAEPDGMVVLAPQGQGLAASDAPALAEAVAKGLPLLAVIADEQTALRASGTHQAVPDAAHAPAGGEAADAQSAPLFRQPGRENEAGRSRRVFALTILVALALGVAALLRFGAFDALLRPAPAPPPAPRARAAARHRDTAHVTTQAPLPAALPLPFAVQVAALPRLADAFAMADSLEAHGRATMIAPVRLRGRGAFYRVQAGPYAARARADSALTAMRAEGLLARGTGSVAIVPYSMALGSQPRLAAARAERARLRAQGVPAFILGQADGTFHLFAGAYDSTAQASLLKDLLTPTGSAGDLIPRAGYVP